MGRPKGVGNIVGWQLHDIHRRLAAGDSPEVIAEANGKPVQTIYDIKWLTRPSWPRFSPIGPMSSPIFRGSISTIGWPS